MPPEDISPPILENEKLRVNSRRVTDGITRDVYTGLIKKVFEEEKPKLQNLQQLSH